MASFGKKETLELGPCYNLGAGNLFLFFFFFFLSYVFYTWVNCAK